MEYLMCLTVDDNRHTQQLAVEHDDEKPSVSSDKENIRSRFYFISLGYTFVACMISFPTKFVFLVLILWYFTGTICANGCGFCSW